MIFVLFFDARTVIDGVVVIDMVKHEFIEQKEADFYLGEYHFYCDEEPNCGHL